MRNLKKILAMALALVMSLSLVTVANATDFTDDADISYKEAVDVMSAIGVINGYEDGSFQPEGTLTREEAAKLICTMLLGSGADQLGTTSSSFTDVSASRWSAPFIEYCVQTGIISGNGDGTFDPTGELTGHAFAKMLLVALGYDASREGYTGAGWTINVASDATAAGIDLDGLALSANITREEAAQMAFQTLEASMVEYATAGTVVTTPDGTTVVTSGSNASKVENNVTNRSNTYNNDVDGFTQFCEEYFSDLKKTPNDTDDFGRPAESWKYKRDDIGTYAKEADATYTEEVELGDIYSDLGLSSRTTAEVSVDGKDGGTVSLTRGSSTKLTDSGNGVLTEAFVDDDDNVTIVVINTYVGEVSRVMTADDVDDDEDPYIEIAPLSGSTGGKFETNVSYEEDDVVIYTLADDEIQSVSLAEVVEDQELTSTTGSSKFVAGGTTYKYNKVNAGAYTSLNDSIDIYMDSYGYVVYVKQYEAGSGNIAFVLAQQPNTNFGETTYEAKLLLTDGTVIIADTDDEDPSKLVNTFVSYTVDDDDIYTLTAKDYTSGAGDYIDLTKGTSKFDINGATSGGVRYANSSTIFLVYDETAKEYSVYTGIANVPSMDGAATVYVNSKTSSSNSVAKYVYISGADSVVANDSKALVYIIAGSKSGLVNDADRGEYYTYDAVVDGQITTIDVKSTVSVSSDILASKLTTNSKDIVTSITPYSITDNDDYAISGTGTKKATDGTVGLGSTYYTYSDDVVVFRIEDNDFKSSSVTSIRDDSNDTFKAVVKDGEVIAIFITVKDDGSSGDEETGGKVSGVDGTVTMAAGSDDKTLRATVLGKEDGVYQILGAIPGNCAKEVSPEQLVYFKVTNKDAGSGFTLTIYDSKGAVVYLESYTPTAEDGYNGGSTGYAAGPVMAYVNIAAKTNASPNAGSGAYSAEDFASGTYTYAFTCGSTTARGTFVVD